MIYAPLIHVLCGVQAFSIFYAGINMGVRTFLHAL